MKSLCIIYVGWIRRLLEGRIPSRNPFSVNITDGEALLTPPRKKSHKCEKVEKGNIQKLTIYEKETFASGLVRCNLLSPSAVAVARDLTNGHIGGYEHQGFSVVRLYHVIRY